MLSEIPAPTFYLLKDAVCLLHHQKITAIAPREAVAAALAGVKDTKSKFLGKKVRELLDRGEKHVIHNDERTKIRDLAPELIFFGIALLGYDRRRYDNHDAPFSTPYPDNPSVLFQFDQDSLGMTIRRDGAPIVRTDRESFNTALTILSVVDLVSDMIGTDIEAAKEEGSFEATKLPRELQLLTFAMSNILQAALPKQPRTRLDHAA